MTQEEKDLLIKDLCARLPYEVKVQYEDGIFTLDHISAMYEEVKLNTPNNYTIDVLEIKPSLLILHIHQVVLEMFYQILNNLLTTVQTPSKCPTRDLPQSLSTKKYGGQT